MERHICFLLSRVNDMAIISRGDDPPIVVDIIRENNGRESVLLRVPDDMPVDFARVLSRNPLGQPTHVTDALDEAPVYEFKDVISARTNEPPTGHAA